MQQYTVPQSPKEDKVVAGFYIKAKVFEINGQDIDKRGFYLPVGVSQLRIELPIELPIDHIEYNLKKQYPDKPTFFFDFQPIDRYTAAVSVYVPLEETGVPTELLVYGLTPVLFRGIPEVKEIELPKAPKLKKVKKK